MKQANPLPPAQHPVQQAQTWEPMPVLETKLHALLAQEPADPVQIGAMVTRLCSYNFYVEDCIPHYLQQDSSRDKKDVILRKFSDLESTSNNAAITYLCGKIYYMYGLIAENAQDNKSLKLYFDQAFFYYIKAANAGYAPACLELGTLYVSKYRCERFNQPHTIEKGLFWIQLAASQGHTQALSELCDLYEEGQSADQYGQSIRKDHDRAATYIWQAYHQAKSAGDVQVFFHTAPGYLYKWARYCLHANSLLGSLPQIQVEQTLKEFFNAMMHMPIPFVQKKSHVYYCLSFAKVMAQFIAPSHSYENKFYNQLSILLNVYYKLGDCGKIFTADEKAALQDIVTGLEKENDREKIKLLLFVSLVLKSHMENSPSSAFAVFLTELVERTSRLLGVAPGQAELLFSQREEEGTYEQKWADVGGIIRDMVDWHMEHLSKFPKQVKSILAKVAIVGEVQEDYETILKYALVGKKVDADTQKQLIDDLKEIHTYANRTKEELRLQSKYRYTQEDIAKIVRDAALESALAWQEKEPVVIQK